ncbi:MAG: TonB-dependent receptor [Marinoscillum sp.]
MKRLSLIIIFGLLIGSAGFGQEKVTLSGYVRDASDGETLIGATVVVNELSSGNITNVYGFYSITVPPGDYTIDFRYVGYETITRSINLTSNQRIDVELSAGEQQLQEVVISAKAEDANVSEVEMSTQEMDIKTIEKIPAFLGEVDVIKSIQLLPGVSSVGEGASGFNVRGGSVGQNLILLDEAPVYNSSHLLGFFSVFNPDAVKDVKLYKGGIPAKYGGRISSVLDVRMKEGNNKRYAVSGGVGTIFSRLAVEGPLIKDKASFIIAGRRSYADVLFKPFVEALQDGAQLYFYDLTLKTNYTYNDKNRIFLSSYLGRDVFMFDKTQGFTWGNKTATLRWNHLFSDQLFSNVTLLVSDYDYSLAFGDDDEDLFEWDSNIISYQFKPEFSYFINTNSELTFGADAIFYRFKPAEARGVSVGEEVDISLDEKQALESSAYVGLEQKMGKMTVQGGIRYSNFNYLGGADVFTYGDTVPGYKKPVIDAKETERGEIIDTYHNLEPRLALKYQLTATSSVKASYNRMAQYIHLISNTTASNPLDLWTPTTNNIKPQIGHQVALGYFRNFKKNMYEASAEVYFKHNENQIDYIDGANLFFNETLEGELLAGIGRAYGLELYLKKNKGKFTGWISYTLGRSLLKVDGIQYEDGDPERIGDWYYTRFDQLHNVTWSAFYEINKWWTLSSNLSVISGTPFTSPDGRYTQQGYLAATVDSRNAGRVPTSHRLDLSATWTFKDVKRNGQERKGEQSLVFTAYNIYARQNPFTIYFRQGRETPENGEPYTTEAVQVSIFAALIPGISYNFKF